MSEKFNQKPLTRAVALKTAGIEAAIMTITPEYATYLLSRNDNNRNVVRSNLDKFVHALTNGQFVLTHQGVAIAKSGRILDGQHRLMAIEKAGIAADMLVTEGWDDSIFMYLDQGASRTPGDKFQQEGVPHPTLSAALAAMIHQGRVQDGDMSRPLKPLDRLQPSELYRLYLECNADRSFDLATQLACSGHLRSIIRPTPAAWMYWNIATNLGAEFAQDLREKTDSGALHASHPLQIAMGRASRMKQLAKTTPKAHELLALMIKGWNAYLSGKETASDASIRWRSAGPKAEEFPRMTLT